MDDRGGAPQSKPTVEVEIFSAAVAVVALGGEHDLTTKTEVAQALARACAHPHVLVDLSACNFMDSSTLAVLFVAYRGQLERDGRLEFVIRPGTLIQRVTKIAGLPTLTMIHETRAAGLASLHVEE
jgi:anti-anti-sigma factor